MFLQGVQAQTVANFFLAFELDLPVIPVLNKIDLKVARPDVVMEQLKNIFEIESDQVLKVSHLMTKPTKCAPSKDSDQPGHPPSLIRIFAVCSVGS